MWRLSTVFSVRMCVQARHGQLNAMGWFGNVGIATPPHPADMQPGGDPLITSRLLQPPTHAFLASPAAVPCHCSGFQLTFFMIQSSILQRICRSSSSVFCVHSSCFLHQTSVLLMKAVSIPQLDTITPVNTFYHYTSKYVLPLHQLICFTNIY